MCRAKPASSTRFFRAADPDARRAPAAGRTPWAKAARPRRRAITNARRRPDGRGQTHRDIRADGPYEPPTTLHRTFQRISLKNFHGISFRFPKDSAGRRCGYGTQRSEHTDEHIGSRLILKY